MKRSRQNKQSKKIKKIKHTEACSTIVTNDSKQEAMFQRCTTNFLMHMYNTDSHHINARNVIDNMNDANNINATNEETYVNDGIPIFERISNILLKQKQPKLTLDRMQTIEKSSLYFRQRWERIIRRVLSCPLDKKWKNVLKIGKHDINLEKCNIYAHVPKIMIEGKSINGIHLIKLQRQEFKKWYSCVKARSPNRWPKNIHHKCKFCDNRSVDPVLPELLYNTYEIYMAYVYYYKCASTFLKRMTRRRKNDMCDNIKNMWYIEKEYDQDGEEIFRRVLKMEKIKKIANLNVLNVDEKGNGTNNVMTIENNGAIIENGNATRENDNATKEHCNINTCNVEGIRDILTKHDNTLTSAQNGMHLCDVERFRIKQYIKKIDRATKMDVKRAISMGLSKKYAQPQIRRTREDNIHRCLIHANMDMEKYKNTLSYIKNNVNQWKMLFKCSKKILCKKVVRHTREFDNFLYFCYYLPVTYEKRHSLHNLLSDVPEENVAINIIKSSIQKSKVLKSLFDITNDAEKVYKTMENTKETRILKILKILNINDIKKHAFEKCQRFEYLRASNWEDLKCVINNNANAYYFLSLLVMNTKKRLFHYFKHSAKTFTFAYAHNYISLAFLLYTCLRIKK